jgi:lysozyme family protein
MNLGNINNELLKLHLFDMGVNAGTKTAVKILQRMLGIVADGIIGNDTLAHIESYTGNIVADYMSARREYYIRIIEKNPKLSIFRRGWFRRVNTTYFK